MMVAQTFGRTLQVGHPSIELTVHLSGERDSVMILAAGKKVSSLRDLVTAMPDIAYGAAADLAALCLHLHGMGRYILITDADAFRARYAGQYAFQQNSDNDPVTAADFPPYDTSPISTPAIVDHELVFFAESSAHGIPYRVSTAWPPADHADAVRFGLLPVLDEE